MLFNRAYDMFVGYGFQDGDRVCKKEADATEMLSLRETLVIPPFGTAADCFSATPEGTVIWGIVGYPGLWIKILQFCVAQDCTIAHHVQ